MDIAQLFDTARTDPDRATQRPESDKTVPNGYYNAEVIDFSVFQGKDGGHYNSIYFRIIDGPQAGKILESFRSITESTKGLVYGQIAMLFQRDPSGAELYDASTNRTTLKGESLGTQVQIQRATNGQWINVDIKRHLAAGPGVRDTTEVLVPRDSITPMEPPTLPDQPSPGARFVDVPHPVEEDIPF